MQLVVMGQKQTVEQRNSLWVIGITSFYATLLIDTYPRLSHLHRMAVLELL